MRHILPSFSDPIVLTLEILKTAKRFLVTVSFLADTGLKAATEKVSKYNLLMKEFPINELLSAPDIPRIGDAVVQVFQHFNKKLRLSPYPVARALPLVEAISRDLNDQMLKVLGSKRLMYVSFKDFQSTIDECQHVFSLWDEQVLVSLEFSYLTQWPRSMNLPISLAMSPENAVKSLSSSRLRVPTQSCSSAFHSCELFANSMKSSTIPSLKFPRMTPLYAVEVPPFKMY